LGYTPAREPPAAPLGAALPAVVALGTVPKLPSLMSAPVNELPATFGEVMAFAFTFTPVTAFLLSCFAPTLFLGNAWIAATLVPPSATVSAMQATTMAGDSLSRRDMNPPLVVGTFTQDPAT
jgi:hypothetical protein